MLGMPIFLWSRYAPVFEVEPKLFALGKLIVVMKGLQKSKVLPSLTQNRTYTVDQKLCNGFIMADVTCNK